jgi:mRNA interferase RelE/StbE
MKVEFDRSFDKSIKKLKDASIKTRLVRIIESVESAKALSEIQNVKKLSGFSTYYRIRIGDYRVGFEVVNSETVRFITVAHRKDIYSIFP